MGILSHTVGIFTHPDREWQKIREDHDSVGHLFLTHVPILALIPVVSFYIGVTQFGFDVGDTHRKLTPGSALSLSILTYAAILAGVYIFGEFIHWMARTYGVEGDEDTLRYESHALAVFVSTPVFLVGFVGLYPDLWVNAAVTLAAVAYSIYLLYEGIPILMNIDKERAFMYASSVVTIGLVLLVIVRIGTVILWLLGFQPIYTD